MAKRWRSASPKEVDARAADRQVSGHCATDRRRPRRRARARHRPSRSEAGQHQDLVRRHRQGSRLRAGQSIVDSSCDGSDVDLSQSPTMTPSATQCGHHPRNGGVHEPGAGARPAVDQRADIWAFGCVLFEMLTGRGISPAKRLPMYLPRFSVASRNGAHPPEASPPALRRLLRRCLARDLRQRLYAMADVRAGNRRAGDGRFRGIRGAQRSCRTRHRLSTHHRFRRVQRHTVVSPDGKMVAFVALVAGRRQIWIRLLARGGAVAAHPRRCGSPVPAMGARLEHADLFHPAATARRGNDLRDRCAWRLAAACDVGPVWRGYQSRRSARRAAPGGRNQLVLTTMSRSGSDLGRRRSPAAGRVSSLRWSPGDQWIALQRSSVSAGFDVALDAVAARGGERSEVVRDSALNGFAWLPDGTGSVYSSSRGSTLLYPPVCNLRSDRP